MKKVVLDTNTIISAHFWKGSPRKILDLVKAGRYSLLTSVEIGKELIRVLGYPKFGLPHKRYFLLLLIIAPTRKVSELNPG